MERFFIEVFAQLHPENSILLTPNRRLAANLHQQYAHYQSKRNKVSWETPRILPLSTWLESCWDDDCQRQHLTEFTLLNEHQEQIIFENALQQFMQNAPLINLNETTKLACSAKNLMAEWRLDINSIQQHHSDDCQAFKKWVSLYSAECQKNGWLDHSSMVMKTIEQMRLGKIALPSMILLYGFIEESPLLQHITAIAEGKGTYVTRLNPPNRIDPLILTCVYNSQEDEILTMARWAKQIHEANPTATIGCVVPTLNQCREDVIKIFDAVFGNQPTTDHAFYNISAGIQLNALPMIQSALFLLSLNKKSIRHLELTRLLTLNTIGGFETESSQRALFDVRFRKLNLDEIELTSLLNINSGHLTLPSLSDSCHDLANRFAIFHDRVTSYPDKGTYREWALRFSDLLNLFGWPGESSLNTREYQQINAWHEALFSLAKLEIVCEPVSYQTALSKLNTIASHSIFHEKSAPATIQILGTLEATGIPFDHLWISGMDDNFWPAAPQPNPLIPRDLQRQLNMPHATSERELTYCQALLAQFTALSNNLITSYAKRRSDSDLAASPFLANYQAVSSTELSLAPFQSIYDKHQEHRQVETFSDMRGPAVAPSHQPTQGGAMILKAQASCPFKAFSEYRLQAKSINSVTQGYQANQRGTLLHKVLEYLWSTLQTQRALLELSHEQLHRLITNCIDHCLQDESPLTIKNEILSKLEKSRLQRLIGKWLQVEANRPSFSIHALEKQQTITLPNLTIAIRVDRIDQLGDNSLMLIDYKTGKDNSISDWLGARMEDPQLPLYSLQTECKVQAISFAEINSNTLEFKGISEFNTEISGVRPIENVTQIEAKTWSEQQSLWANHLQKLADDFASGQAAVDPKDINLSCQWCDLSSLCRINEIRKH